MTKFATLLFMKLSEINCHFLMLYHFSFIKEFETTNLKLMFDSWKRNLGNIRSKKKWRKRADRRQIFFEWDFSQRWCLSRTSTNDAMIQNLIPMGVISCLLHTEEYILKNNEKKNEFMMLVTTYCNFLNFFGSTVHIFLHWFKEKSSSFVLCIDLWDCGMFEVAFEFLKLFSYGM